MRFQLLQFIPFFGLGLAAPKKASCVAVRNPETTKISHCDQQGALHNLELLDKHPRASFHACDKHCLRKKGCQSFAFGKGECRLFKATLDQQNFHKKSSSYRFADRECFTLACPITIPITTSTTTSTSVQTSSSITSTSPSASSSSSYIGTSTPPTPAPCPTSVSFAPGQFSSGPAVIAKFCNGAFTIFQDDGNFVAYPEAGAIGWQSNTWNDAGFCNSGGCEINFNALGDLELSFFGDVVWNTG